MTGSTELTTNTTKLTAKLRDDGTFAYSVPKTEAQKLMRAYDTCRRYSRFPALEQNANAASKSLAFLMLDLGVDGSQALAASLTTAKPEAK